MSGITYELLEQLRTKARTENSTQEAFSALTQALGGNATLAERMFAGPTAEDLDALKQNKEAPGFNEAFDETFGLGASKVYDNTYWYEDVANAATGVLTAPDTLLQAGKEGVVKAALGGGAFLFESGVDAGLIPEEYRGAGNKFAEDFSKAITTLRDTQDDQRYIGGDAPGVTDVTRAVGEVGGQFVLPGGALYKGARAVGLGKTAAVISSEALVSAMVQSGSMGDETTVAAVQDFLTGAPDTDAGRMMEEVFKIDPEDPEYLNRLRFAADGLATLGVTSLGILAAAKSYHAFKGELTATGEENLRRIEGVLNAEKEQETLDAAAAKTKVASADPTEVIDPSDIARSHTEKDLLTSVEAQVLAGGGTLENAGELQKQQNSARKTSRFSATVVKTTDTGVGEEVTEVAEDVVGAAAGAYVVRWRPLSLDASKHFYTVDGLKNTAELEGQALRNDIAVLDLDDLGGRLGDELRNDIELLASMGTRGTGGLSRLRDVIDDVIPQRVASQYVSLDTGKLKELSESVRDNIENYAVRDDWAGLINDAIVRPKTMDEQLGYLVALLQVKEDIGVRLAKMDEALASMSPQVVSPAFEDAVARLHAMRLNITSTSDRLRSHYGGALNSIKMFYEGRLPGRGDLKDAVDPDTGKIYTQRKLTKKLREAEKIQEEMEAKIDDVFGARSYDELESSMILDGMNRGMAYRDASKYSKEFVDDLRAQGVSIKEFARNREAMLKGLEPDATMRTVGEKVMDHLLALRYGAMLSNVATHEANVLSMVANLVATMGSEFAVGGSKEKYMTAQRLLGMIDGISEAASVAVKSFRSGTPHIAPYHHTFSSTRPFTTEDWGIKPTTLVGKAAAFPLNAFGHALSLTQRTMVASEEFVRTMVARGEEHMMLTMQGSLIGKTGEELKSFVQSEMLKRFDKNGVALSPFGMARANKFAFAQNLDTTSKYGMERVLARVGDVVNRPMGRLTFFPFYNTVIQLMRTGWRLTPIANGTLFGAKVPYVTKWVNSRLYDDLNGVNGKSAQSIARAQMLIGTSLSVSAFGLAQAGYLTGAAPSDVWDATQQRMVTVPPFSLKLPGMTTALDYSRFEPLATPLKVVASMVQVGRTNELKQASGKYDVNPGAETSDLIAGTTIAFAQILSSSPFTQPIEDLVHLFASKAPMDERVGRLGESYLDTYIPSVFRHATVIANEGQVFDPADFTQFVQARFNLFLDQPPPVGKRRNLLGEVNVVPTYSRIELFQGVPEKSDPVLNVLYDAMITKGADFKPPSQSEVYPGTQMKLVETLGNDGQKTTMYDKLLDTYGRIRLDKHGSVSENGKTLREALRDVISDPRFAEKTYGVEGLRGTGGRTEAMSFVIGQYRRAALGFLEVTDEEFKMRRERLNFNQMNYKE